MSADLLALAERCEAATAGQQHELLTAAYEALIQLPGPPLSYDRQCLFLRYLGAGAFTDAALTLVPEGWFVLGLSEAASGERSQCGLRPRDLSGPPSQGFGATLALAICAAALRARAA